MLHISQTGDMAEIVFSYLAECQGYHHYLHILASAAIPLEGCYLGWQESLILLAQLVEAKIRRAILGTEGGSTYAETSRRQLRNFS